MYRLIAIICLLAASVSGQSIFDPNAPATPTRPVAVPKTEPVNETQPLAPVAVPSKPLPPKAQAAKAKYEASIAKARAEYEKQAKAAALLYGGVLDQSIKEATKAGDLDLALSIKAERASLDVGPTAVSGNLLVDNWHTETWMNNKKTITYEVLDGRRAIVFNCVKRDGGSLSQMVNVRPNTAYQVTGWVKTKNLVDVERANGEEWGAFLCINNDRSLNDEHSEMVYGTSDWKLLTINFNSGQRASMNIVARIGGNGHTNSGVIAFSDIKLVETK